jgi:hypothetical protein
VLYPSLPEQFQAFAAAVARDGATTYADICLSVAEDPDLLELMGHAPEAQRRPNLLLAAVHFLLLGGARHPLAAHYDTVGLVLGAGGPAPHDVADDFRDFCLTQRAALVELLASRSTQTNEVGRCAALLPALATVAAHHPGRPLSLLDLGTSAGLNLLFDHYRYRYRQRSDGAVTRAGPEGSGVVLDCTLRSDRRQLPALGPPPVAARVGLDRQPIDPTSEDGSRWLLACLWPDNLDRFARMRAALAVARTTPDRPRLHRGDIVDDLARVAGTIPDDTPLVVFHSWVAAYLTEARQRELVGAVAQVAATRPVHHVYAEEPYETPGLPTPPSSHPHDPDRRTALVHLDAEGSPPVRLADMHPHGTWLLWWGGTR